MRDDLTCPRCGNPVTPGAHTCLPEPECDRACPDCWHCMCVCEDDE